MFHFNHSISRTGSHSAKYDLRKAVFGTEDLVPMWIADMDLPTPPFVLNAIKSRLNHTLLGYTNTPDSVYQAIISWQAQHQYKVTKSQIVFTNNVTNGLYMAISTFTKPGDAILVQPPIYPPFLLGPTQNNRTLIESPLLLTDTRYEIDFTAFEKSIVDNSVKLFMLCNPHNPSGRVWLKPELLKLANICLKHNVKILSDETHSDLIYAPNKHIPIASLSTEIADICITLNSPDKTFNLGGLHIGYVLIANPKLKGLYLKTCKQNAIGELNVFAQEALTAAYTQQGQHWRDELVNHFARNIQLLETFFKQEMPKVKIIKPDASYLVWIDFRALFSSQAELKDWIIEKAKLGLNDGESFGGESQMGTGFMRINLAVAKPTLDKALRQLKQAKYSLPVL